VESPGYAIAAGQYTVVKDCLAQLGAGPLNRAKLGYSIGVARLTMADVNREFMTEMAAAGAEPDPRLTA
jgi:hypothetical protein